MTSQVITGSRLGEGKAAIDVVDVRKSYRIGGGSHEALRDVSLSIASGEFTCVVGESGCGKSTLLYLLGGLIDPDGGRVDKTSDEVAMVFQEPRLLPWLSVRSNVAFALHDLPRAEALRRADEVLETVRLDGVGDRYPHQLSGGMQQRTAIARALAVNPDVLLMDEPFSALDEMTARRLRLELLALWEDLRTTVVFVTHNALEASFLADRVVIMKPQTIEADVRVPLERPRSYEDPALFNVYQDIVGQLGDIEANRHPDRSHKP